MVDPTCGNRVLKSQQCGVRQIARGCVRQQLLATSHEAKLTPLESFEQARQKPSLPRAVDQAGAENCGGNTGGPRPVLQQQLGGPQRLQGPARGGLRNRVEGLGPVLPCQGGQRGDQHHPRELGGQSLQQLPESLDVQLIVVGITGRLDAGRTVHDVGQSRGDPGGQPGRVELEWQGGDACFGQPGHLRAGPNKAGHPPPAGAGRQADRSPNAARGARHQQMSGRVLEGRHQPTREAREGWARSSSTRQTATSA